MTTPKKATANRANAQRSTGPRTRAGKAVARLNAVTHGLRSQDLVVPGEDPGEWEAFRAGIVAGLAPAGTLETGLADRAAALSWRLRRVAVFKTGATAAGIDRAVTKARGAETPAPWPT